MKVVAAFTYRYAAETLGVDIDQLLLIATHDWDVNGALPAGAQAAFLKRPGAVRAPHARIPNLAAPTLTALAEALVEMHR